MLLLLLVLLFSSDGWLEQFMELGIIHEKRSTTKLKNVYNTQISSFYQKHTPYVFIYITYFMFFNVDDFFLSLAACLRYSEIAIKRIFMIYFYAF